MPMPSMSNWILASYLQYLLSMQEGFASEVKPDWLVRLYFMSFVFTTLVIFEVVLLFVVDGFELIVQHCDEHGELYCHRKITYSTLYLFSRSIQYV